MSIDNIVMACDIIQELHLLDLNDHCLLKVCEYLDVFEVINLSQTCRRLQNLAKMAAINFKTFSLCEYKLYDEHVDELIKFPTILNFIAPYIVSLDLSTPHINLNEFGQLKSINELVSLKELIIGNLPKGISSDEISQFVEKTLNIESLTVDFSSLKFPFNVLSKLRNLKKLYVKGTLASTEWMHLLRIEQLTDLTIDLQFKCYSDRTLPIINFLTILASKKTLTRIDLRHMHFDDRLFNVLSLLNITKLRITTPWGVNFSTFYSSLVNTTLSNLTHLDIFKFIDANYTLRLIKRFKQLEELKLFGKSFLDQIPHLFNLSTRSRPTLMLIYYFSSYKNPYNVMIDFYNCRYMVNVKQTTG